ncbi:MAG: hypothetical protein JWP75_1812 [Frondihabitans sp.]|nr:hypothetical protein [Frondihabitans sp.]
MTPVAADSSSEWGRVVDGSIEQRMLVAAGELIGTELRPRSIVLDNRSRVEVEGMDAAGRVVAQLVANQGTYKPSYRNKVMADLFKLLWVRSSVPTAERAVLVITELVVKALGGWVAVAAADLGVEVLVFDGETVAPLAATAQPAPQSPHHRER